MSPYSLARSETERALITLSLAFVVSCGVQRSNLLGPPIATLEVPASSVVAQPPRIAIQQLTPSLVLMPGETFILSQIMRTPDGEVLTPRNSRWLTDHPEVVGLDANTGLLNARAMGNAVVTVTLTEAPAVQAHLNVTVHNARQVRQIDVAPSAASLALGQRRRLTANVRMANGEVSGDVVWSSSDTTRATVAPTTGEVTANSPGAVTIRASYRLNPKFFGLCEFEILPPGAAAPTVEGPRPTVSRAPKPSPTPDYTLPQNRPPGRPGKWW
jgi:hypothetical protein